MDYIRAIASLAVALFHLGGKTLPVLKYGWLGVEMFFLLSGFIICQAIPGGYTFKTAGRFIMRRIVRIEPPYLISVCLVVAIRYFWVTGYRPDWTGIALHAGYLNGFFNKPFLSPVYWTLGIEFQYYLFVALFFPLITKRAGALFIPILCIISLFYRPANTLFVYFPIFALGILYFQYLNGINSLITTLILMPGAAICSLYSLGLPSTAAALTALLILILPLNSTPVVRFFSRISFSLYLTHDMVGSSVVVYLGSRLPKTIVFKGVEFITGIVVSIAFAWLFNRLIEYPCLKLSRQISYKNT